MKASYTITTDVKKQSSNEGLSTSLRVFVLVDSKSNLVPQYTPIYIDTEEQFFYYFSDNLEEYSDSLRIAYRLLNSGYTLLCLNVRKCENRLSYRLYKDLSSSYFFHDFITNDINTFLEPESEQDRTKLAVKLNVEELGKESYVLLEQYVRTSFSNTLIYTNKQYPITKNNFHRAIHVDYKLPLKEKCEYIYNQLLNNSYFFAKMSPDYRYISIASPYSFRGIGIYKNCEPLEYDPEFNAEYIERVRFGEQIIDFKSTYTSDLADLYVMISKQFNKYTFSVIKYSNNKAHTTETFTGDLKNILERINSSSLFLRVNYREDITYIPTGTFKLYCIPTNDEVDDRHYETALETLWEYKQQEIESNENINLDIRCNIVYEPDIYSIRSQILISDIFDNENIPIIKVFNYLDSGNEQQTQLVAYFDTRYYSYLGERYSSKELFLKFLIEDKLGVKRDDIYILGEERPVPYPLYVNEFEQTPTGFNAPTIACLYNDKRFEIKELLIISMVNSLSIELSKENETDMYTIIRVTENYFENIMNYSPKISLAYFMKNGSNVAAGFLYSVNNPEEIKLLELNLKV